MSQRTTTATRILLYTFYLFEVILLAVLLYLVLTIFFPVLATLTGAGEEMTIFQKIPIVLVLSWIGLMMGYFGWCTYFYNYNFGRSDGFWRKFVARCEVAKAEGITENEVYEELAAPRQNPYAAETFGFPPGTVRGSLALTIVIGGLALLVNFFGGEGFAEFGRNSVLRDYFEFFKDAFLMVVAFYFGTKALDIIQKERTQREEYAAMATAASASGGELPTLSDVSKRIPDAAPAAAPAAAPLGVAGMPLTIPSLPEVPLAAPPPSPATVTVGETARKQREEMLDEHYPHVSDLAAEQEVRRELAPEDLEAFAQRHGLELAVVKAVIKVESSGKGFLKDGRPKILFEGHVFWRQLVKVGVRPEEFAARFPSIVYKSWTRRHYKGGAGEYDRLNLAKQIHERAALSSASWGLFQIMGYHYERLGYDDVKTFVSAHEQSEKYHLDAFGRYLVSYNLLDYLRDKEWAKFAKGYNGPGYAQNQYDVKLQNFYEQFSQENGQG